MIVANTHIRWLIRRDMPRIEEIESRTLFNRMTAEEVVLALRQRNNIGMCIEHEGHVCGFMIYALEKNRLDVKKFEVMEIMRGIGLGTAMINKLKAKLNERRTAITFTLDERNVGGCEFLKANGFKAISLLRDHIEPDVDGIHFRYVLPVDGDWS